MKTKTKFSPGNILRIAVLTATFALPSAYATGSPSDSAERFDFFRFSSDSQWFGHFGNFQTPYSNYFSLLNFTLPSPQRLLPAAQVVQGPVALSAPQIASDRPVQYVAYSSSGSYSSGVALDGAPNVVTPIEIVPPADSAIHSVSRPAETASDSVAPVPRRLVAPPPTPTKKPVYSNL